MFHYTLTKFCVQFWGTLWLIRTWDFFTNQIVRTSDLRLHLRSEIFFCKPLGIFNFVCVIHYNLCTWIALYVIHWCMWNFEYLPFPQPFENRSWSCGAYNHFTLYNKVVLIWCKTEQHHNYLWLRHTLFVVHMKNFFYEAAEIAVCRRNLKIFHSRKILRGGVL